MVTVTVRLYSSTIAVVRGGDAAPSRLHTSTQPARQLGRPQHFYLTSERAGLGIQLTYEFARLDVTLLHRKVHHQKLQSRSD